MTPRLNTKTTPPTHPSRSRIGANHRTLQTVFLDFSVKCSFADAPAPNDPGQRNIGAGVWVSIDDVDLSIMWGKLSLEKLLINNPLVVCPLRY